MPILVNLKKESKMIKRTPESAYECWCMPCRECIHYDASKDKCLHPENPDNYEEQKEASM